MIDFFKNFFHNQELTETLAVLAAMVPDWKRARSKLQKRCIRNQTDAWWWTSRHNVRNVSISSTHQEGDRNLGDTLTTPVAVAVNGKTLIRNIHLKYVDGLTIAKIVLNVENGSGRDN